MFNWKSFALSIIAGLATGGISVISLRAVADEPPPDLLPPEDGGGRPIDSLCVLAPKVNSLVWNARPALIWRGRVSKIEVVTAGEVVWEEMPEIEEERGISLVYPESLQPGENYTWRVFNQRGTQIYNIPFQIMDGEQGEEIAAELEPLLKDAVEEAIWAQINYFARHELWTDALRVAFAAQDEEVVAGYREAVVRRLCE